MHTWLAAVAVCASLLSISCDVAGGAKGRRPTTHETASGTFTPSSNAGALDQPEGSRTVVTLEAGHTYKLIKRGGPGDAWCKVDANGQQGWVLCAGGGEERRATPPPANPAAPATKAEGHASGCATTCSHAPLFASAPSLTPLDKEVLALCPTHPDGEVSGAEARRFIAAHQADPRVQQALSAAGRPGSKEANVDWLVSLWTGTGPRNAFTHVFCGDDWDREKLGGLHFLPRYAELEAERRICFDGAVKHSGPITGGQYLIRYHGVAPWSCGEKSVGGFPVEHDPVAMLALGVRAFARCCHRGAANDGGVYSAGDTNGVRYQIWCGTRNGGYGIATFYPTNDQATCGE
jgi:hypothetical protein